MPTPNRYGDLSSDARVAAINAQLSTDQTYQRLFSNYRMALAAGPASKNPAAQQAYAAVVTYLDQQGLQPPDGYTQFSANGQLVRQPETTWKDLLVPLAPIVGGLGAAALGVGGGFGAGGGGELGAAGLIGPEGEAGATTAAGAGGGATLTGTVTDATAATGDAGVAAGGAGAGAGAGGAGAGSTLTGTVLDASVPSATGGIGSFLKNNLSWLSPLIGVGGQIGGALISANATKDAAEIQKQYLEDALAYEKERDAYARTTEANRYGALQSAEAPYLASGREANSAMTRFLGLPDSSPGPVQGTNYTINPAIASGGAIPPGSPTTMPVPIPGGYQGSPPINASPTTSATVPVIAPNGQTYQVPTAQLSEALANGGQVVNG